MKFLDKFEYDIDFTEQFSNFTASHNFLLTGCPGSPFGPVDK